jgi:hypothetical protein
MPVPAKAKGAIAIATCISLLVITALWNNYPIHVPQVGSSEKAPFGITDQSQIASVTEMASKMAIYLAVLAGVAAYVSSVVHARKILTGALASTTSALLALMLLEATTASAYEVPWAPRVDALFLFVCATSFLVGAASSWAMGWFPKSSSQA